MATVYIFDTPVPITAPRKHAADWVGWNFGITRALLNMHNGQSVSLQKNIATQISPRITDIRYSWSHILRLLTNQDIEHTVLCNGEHVQRAVISKNIPIIFLHAIDSAKQLTIFGAVEHNESTNNTK